jgi:hypothetical protein
LCISGISGFGKILDPENPVSQKPLCAAGTPGDFRGNWDWDFEISGTLYKIEKISGKFQNRNSEFDTLHFSGAFRVSCVQRCEK